MKNKDGIFKDYCKLRKIALQYYKKDKYDDSLKTISLLANFMYKYNIIFSDYEIEDLLKTIAEKVVVLDFQKFQPDNNKIVFYDMFALDMRGLALIYLKALLTLGYKILYITYADKKDTLGLIEENLNSSPLSSIYYIESADEIAQIHEMSKIIFEFSPAKILNYTTPHDVVGMASISLFENKCERFLINLTDHAFWLGVLASDYILEFRNFGVNISLKYRSVRNENDIVLPYYPSVIDGEFEGFNFSTEGKKLIFSGGALYKTLGSDIYYEIVKNILNKYQDTIFLYAGFGDDTELKKIINSNKFKGRIYYISERSDLLEVMKRSYFYLSTYPLAGGLMTQYAVAANKLPLTLLRSKGDIEELLLKPEKLKVFFEDKDDFYMEVDRLMSDEKYKSDQEKNLEGQLVTELEFMQELQCALINHKTKYQYMKQERFFDKEQFSDLYVKATSYIKYSELFVSKQTLGLWLIYFEFPLKVILGLTFKIINKIKKI